MFSGLFAHRVFLREDKVFHLNAEIAAMRHWPADPPFRPYPVARLIRYSVRLVGAQSRTFGRFVESIFCWLKRAVRPLPHIVHHADYPASTLVRRTKRCLAKLSPCLSPQRHPKPHLGHSDLEVGGNAHLEVHDSAGTSSPHQDIDGIAEEFISLLHEVVVEDFRLHFLRWKNNTYVNRRS